MQIDRRFLARRLDAWTERIERLRQDARLLRPEVRDHSRTVLAELDERLGDARQAFRRALGAGAGHDDGRDRTHWDLARTSARRLENLLRWFAMDEQPERVHRSPRPVRALQQS